MSSGFCVVIALVLLPTKFEPIINLKTAKAVPPSLLLRGSDH
jgi:hypothetical protein